jgi:predicted RNA methylase
MQVDAYEQGRPGYPLEAVQYALKQLYLDDGYKRVVDLAAGTGKLTRCSLF